MTNQRGFTLVELVVVIAVLVILVTISATLLSRYQADSRDIKRTANVSVIVEALEKYYDERGEYPSCQAITASGSTVISSTLKGIDPSALLVPTAGPGVTNSIRCGATLVVTGVEFIEYRGDNSPGCTGSDSCQFYVLRYRNEASNQILTIRSRRGIE